MARWLAIRMRPAATSPAAIGRRLTEGEVARNAKLKRQLFPIPGGVKEQSPSISVVVMRCSVGGSVLSESNSERSACRLRVVLAGSDVARIVAEMQVFCFSFYTFSYIVVEGEPGKTTMVWSFSNQEEAQLFIRRFERLA